MTDAEAEATLLALGPRLTWRFVAMEDSYVDSWYAVIPTGGYYETYRYPWKEMITCRAIDRDDKDNEYHLACTIEAAKLACERHFAIGEWY